MCELYYLSNNRFCRFELFSDNIVVVFVHAITPRSCSTRFIWHHAYRDCKLVAREATYQGVV